MNRTRFEVALDALAVSGRLRLRVTGSSMTPAIRSGSSVLIRRVALDAVRPGDIVLTGSGDGVRLHRLVSVVRGPGGAMLITRGDNDMENDPPVSADRLLGILDGIVEPPSKSYRLSCLLNSIFRRAEPV